MFPLALATIAFAFYSDIAMTALQSRIVLRGARVVQHGVPVGAANWDSIRWASVRRFVLRLALYFLMFDRQRSIVSGHFSVMLPGNWVGCPFGTFFKHASAFNKVLGVGHWAPPCGVQFIQSIRLGFCSRPERFSPVCRACPGEFFMPDRRGLATARSNNK